MDLEVNESPAQLADVEEALGLSLRPGGTWAPNANGAPAGLALVLPFRNRTAHLATFLRHLHPFLQRQGRPYRILLIEQV